MQINEINKKQIYNKSAKWHCGRQTAIKNLVNHDIWMYSG